MSETTTKWTPAEIYNYVVSDGGRTLATDIAKTLGVRGVKSLTRAIVDYMVEQKQLGNNVQFPTLNIQLATSRRSGAVRRNNSDAKLQISAARLKDLGFGEVFNFTTENVDGMLVLRPVGVTTGAEAELTVPATTTIAPTEVLAASF